MKRTVTLMFGILVVMVVACTQTTVTGSGNVVTLEENYSGFDKVDVSHGFQVDIEQGDEFSVILNIDDNIAEYLRVGVEGSTLKIGLELLRGYQDITLQADVTMPELTGLELSGGSQAKVSGSGDDLSIDASGGSGADLSAFPVVNANIDASGGSQVTVNVSGTLNVDASGGSQVYYLGDPKLGEIDTSGGAQVRSR